MGGVAGKIAGESFIDAKYDGILEIDELRTVEHKEKDGSLVDIVVTHMAEMKILDPNTKIPLVNKPIPDGSKLYFKQGNSVKREIESVIGLI